MSDYVFTSKRLGFRTWQDTDPIPMAEINADREVMAFFPATQSEKETAGFIKRMQHQYEREGYCYFAVEKLEDKAFIGFIGLSQQIFKSDFTPCVDIGWRLKKSEWNKGFATEGAMACLGFGFDELGLERVYAIAPLANTRSIMIMKKIGMRLVKTFDHPKLLKNERLKKCVLYEKLRS